MTRSRWNRHKLTLWCSVIVPLLLLTVWELLLSSTSEAVLPLPGLPCPIALPFLPPFWPCPSRSESDVPPYIAAYVNSAIRAAFKDPVGRRDFALAADGARTAPRLTSTFDVAKGVSMRHAENILDEDLRSASCWLFPGHRAQVGIKIPAFIYPTHFTIDHIPQEVAADIRQAPREVVLWGVLDGPDNEARYKQASGAFKISPLNETGDGPPITAGASFLPIGVVEYAIYSSFHIQTFPIDFTVVTSGIWFGAFVLEVRSNWGATSTKVYRVRIHGEKAKLPGEW